MAKDIYEQKTKKFLDKKGVRMSVTKVGKKPYFYTDKESRNIYLVTLDKKGGKKISYTFGDSISNTEKGLPPSRTDMIYSFNLDKYNGSYDDFVADFGYEKDKNSKKIYNQVMRNSEKYDKIFTEKDRNQLNKIYEDY